MRIWAEAAGPEQDLVLLSGMGEGRRLGPGAEAMGSMADPALGQFLEEWRSETAGFQVIQVSHPDTDCSVLGQ